MTREEYLKSLILEKGYTVKGFASEIDIPYSTLLSMLNGSLGGAAVDSVIKICKGLNISINDLQNCGIKNIQDLILTEKEKMLVVQYRSHLEMQPAIDKLLGLEDELVALPMAARSETNKPVGLDYISREKLEQLRNDKSVADEVDL